MLPYIDRMTIAAAVAEKLPPFLAIPILETLTQAIERRIMAKARPKADKGPWHRVVPATPKRPVKVKTGPLSKKERRAAMRMVMGDARVGY